MKRKTRTLAGRVDGGVLMKDDRGPRGVVTHALMSTPYMSDTNTLTDTPLASFKLFGTAFRGPWAARAGNWQRSGRVTGYGFEGDKFVITFARGF